jgi:hypothetical protein
VEHMRMMKPAFWAIFMIWSSLPSCQSRWPGISLGPSSFANIHLALCQIHLAGIELLLESCHMISITLILKLRASRGSAHLERFLTWRLKNSHRRDTAFKNRETNMRISLFIPKKNQNLLWSWHAEYGLTFSGVDLPAYRQRDRFVTTARTSPDFRANQKAPPK